MQEGAVHYPMMSHVQGSWRSAKGAKENDSGASCRPLFPWSLLEIPLDLKAILPEGSPDNLFADYNEGVNLL